MHQPFRLPGGNTESPTPIGGPHDRDQVSRVGERPLRIIFIVSRETYMLDIAELCFKSR